MNLEDMLESLVGREGGYSNNPKDSGGETMWGVTEQVARAYGYHGPMSMLPRNTAKQIFKARYWFEPGFDKVNLLSQRIAEELLDTGVNMGQGIAGKFLQRALNALNRGGTIFPDMTVDGRVGPMTFAALKTYLITRGSQDGEAVLLRLLNDQQGVRYLEIAEARPKDEEFIFGQVRNRVV